MHGLRPQRIEIGGEPDRLACEQCGARVGRQRSILQRANVRVVKLRRGLRAGLFAPARPELGRRVRGAIASFGLADGHQQLRIGKQTGNLVGPLVAQVLADAFFHHCLARVRTFGTLGLDDNQGNAVHVADHVGRAVVRALRREHLQLFGHVPAVGSRVCPVDHRDGGLVLLAVGHELGDCDAEREFVVQPLVGGQQAFGQAQRRQLSYDLVDAAGREWVLLALVFVATRLQDLDEPRHQQPLARAATAQRQRIGGADEVPAQVAQQVQRGDVGAVLFAGVRSGVHRATSVSTSVRGTRRLPVKSWTIRAVFSRRKLSSWAERLRTSACAVSSKSAIDCCSLSSGIWMLTRSKSTGLTRRAFRPPLARPRWPR
ncbi:hypothetical protein D3C86_1320580 [compost metagenome]